ncbi:MAG TPA: OsmC family protein [Casimicrobiaceae bacterium]|nr:OsmC family protein [Casimicrobiaceae bacterium]
MVESNLAATLARAVNALGRRPDMGLHDDAPATARWDGDVRVATSHANGTTIQSDMPRELGGAGERITPGWLFRAGLAACATTSIAMAAAAQGIALTLLEIRVGSRSDTRGLLGMRDDDGQQVYAGPQDLALDVRIAAPGVDADRLRKLVDDGCRCSPVPNAVQHALPMPIRVDVVTETEATP